jgi:cyclase
MTWCAAARAAVLTGAVTVVGCAPHQSADRATTDEQPRLELIGVGRDTYAAIRREPLALAGNANSLIVIGQRSVIVVDAQFTREATFETLAAIRGLTSKPVSHVINTHWHDDHFAGNQVYRDTFPEVRFVLHENTLADLKTLGAPNRTGTRDAAPPLVAEFSRRLTAGLGVDSTAISPMERESLVNALRIMRQYLGELSSFREETDGIVVRDRLVLGEGINRVEVFWFGRGNTRGDLVVHVPGQGVVASGDLLVWPVPFAFGSYPRDWVAVLDSVASLRPSIIVPGHGVLQRDLLYLRQVQQVLAAARDSGAAAAARGDSLAVMLRDVRLARVRRSDVKDDGKWLGWMFENFFQRPVLTAAYNQARASSPPSSAFSRDGTALPSR